MSEARYLAKGLAEGEFFADEIVGNIEKIEDIMKLYSLTREETNLTEALLMTKTFAGLHSTFENILCQKEAYQARIQRGISAPSENTQQERIRLVFNIVDPQDKQGTYTDLLSRGTDLLSFLYSLKNEDVLTVARQMVYIDKYSDIYDGCSSLINKNPTHFVNRMLQGRFNIYNNLRKKRGIFQEAPLWDEGKEINRFPHAHEADPELKKYPLYFDPEEINRTKKDSEPEIETVPDSIDLLDAVVIKEKLWGNNEIRDMFLKHKILVTYHSHSDLIDYLCFCTAKEINKFLKEINRLRDTSEINDITAYLRDNQNDLIASLKNNWKLPANMKGN